MCLQVRTSHVDVYNLKSGAVRGRDHITDNELRQEKLPRIGFIQITLS